jgi:hypothetical protein
LETKMNMRFWLWAAVISAAAAFGGVVAAQDAPKKIDLKVLYAGKPDAPRTADFKQFLDKTFSEVGTVELKALDAKAAERFDVVIVDSPTPYGVGDEGFKMPEAPVLTTDFTKPTILMGAAGGRVLRELKIKLHWL